MRRTRRPISYVFEHMLFKGTEKRGVGQIASMIESVGGDINAYTSFDNTVYHLTVPSRHFGTGLDVISDAIQHSSFDPAELKKELEVVLEELRMNEDNPGRNPTSSSPGVRRAPVRQTCDRYVNTVEFTRDQILDFFNRWYIPNNMTLVIAGDDAATALAAVKKSSRISGKGPAQKRPVSPGRDQDRGPGPSVQAHRGLLSTYLK
jgi:zinc protease